MAEGNEQEPLIQREIRERREETVKTVESNKYLDWKGERGGLRKVREKRGTSGKSSGRKEEERWKRDGETACKRGTLQGSERERKKEG